MRTRVVLALAAGLFLVSLDSLFACSTCIGVKCYLYANGYEFCGTYVDDENGTRVCSVNGRRCENWIPGGDNDPNDPNDHCDIAYPQCRPLYIEYEPCSQGNGSSGS